VDAVQHIAPPKAPFLLTHTRELAEVFVAAEHKDWKPRASSIASTAPGSEEEDLPDSPLVEFPSRASSANFSSMRRSSTICSFKSCMEIEPPNTLGIEQHDQIYFEIDELEDEKRFKRNCGTCMTYPSWWTACFAR
jgi:hypothetical protein